MPEIGSLIFFYAETPLHAGSGTGLGAIDLPIQRERMSNLPVVQGSGIKGAMREQVGPRLPDNPRDTEALFGPEPPKNESGMREKLEATPDEFGGAMSVLDARLLLLPVRTVFGGWAWVTSPLILERLTRDLEVVGQSEATKGWAGLQNRDDNDAWVSKKKCSVAEKDAVLLEDFQYVARGDDSVDRFGEWLARNALPDTKGYEPFRARLAEQLVVVTDTEMRFLATHATEVQTRVCIDHNTGTVKRGALWTEESLPAESVLWSVAFFAKERRPKKKDDTVGPRDAETLKKLFVDAANGLSRVRLGGDRTTGRGLVGLRVPS